MLLGEMKNLQQHEGCACGAGAPSVSSGPAYVLSWAFDIGNVQNVHDWRFDFLNFHQ